MGRTSSGVVRMKSKPATKSERRRIEIIKSEIGCIACKLDNRGYTPADAHHMLSGGNRISHAHTIPLCKLHHTGFDAERDGIERMYEPSLADSKRDFEDKYGSEEYLLKFTNVLVKAFKDRTIGGAV